MPGAATLWHCRGVGYGERADRIAGGLSRLLHVRGARNDTSRELEARYLDLAPAVMFPCPPAVEPVAEAPRLVDRALGTTTLRWRSTHEVLSPSYRERHEGEYRTNQIAWARWLRAGRRRRRHCLVYVHGWLEPGSWVEELTLFRKWLRELDVDILHVALPFHGRRQPRGSLFSGEYFWTADLVRSVEGVRQAVCDSRAAVEWARRQGYERVGVSGISLGGAIVMLLACVTPTPDFIVPIVAHLELEDAVENAPILWRMKQDLERWGVGEKKRRELLRRLGWSSYRPLLAPENQLWVQALDDGYIGADLVRAQWQAWSQPNICWLEGGHMTFPLHASQITGRMRAFLSGFDPTPG
jgi:alpha-beta hydrolase superfamily lysophospholipase